MDIELIKADLQAMKEECDQLERNLPAHGLKPNHLQRIEALEELIKEKEKELAWLIQNEK
ncbi:MAG: hypothetical protein JRG97_05205 [Deltaproteobacteria bacterium]|nr:hypothetical protein [Deltaproteobacteria bacterium]MBW2050744.1 hypothetical protein [Deltaproteobacteria bacterium]MBW2140455.1 hypothetical protein [Deltaproteobacteria bacterium]